MGSTSRSIWYTSNLDDLLRGFLMQWYLCSATCNCSLPGIAIFVDQAVGEGRCDVSRRDCVGVIPYAELFPKAVAEC